jgi:uncharacterized protein
VIAGAGGVIGRHLMRAAAARYDVSVLTRGGTRPQGVSAHAWNPAAARQGDEPGIDAVARALDGADAVVNLAGSSIAAGRLGPAHLARLQGSRVDVGRTLTVATQRCRRPPAAFFQASGDNIYGDGGEAELDESAPVDGDHRLQAPGRAWEASTAEVAEMSRRVVGRIGMVLARDAEAFRKVTLPIRLFVGGPLGSGRQWWPWIEAGDLSRAILWLLERDDAAGVYNLAGEPERQIDFARAAARRLRRPALLPVPAFALRLLVGGVADELLLSSRRVVAARLRREGFAFEAGTLDAAMARLLP